MKVAGYDRFFHPVTGLAVGMLCCAAACRSPSAEPPDLPSGHTEMRTMDGRLLLSLRRKPYGFRAEGDGLAFRVERDASGARAVGAPGGPLRATVRGEEIDIESDAGLAYRVRRVGPVLRVGDAAGVPLARVEQRAGEAVAYDAGGVPLARASVSGDRVEVRDRDARPVGFLTPARPLEPSALAFVPSLPLAVRALIFALSTESAPVPGS